MSSNGMKAQVSDDGDIFSTLDGIWKEILQVDEIDPNVGFFEAGGNSIYAMKICIKVKKSLGLNLKAIEFESSPSLFELATKLKQMSGEA